MRAAPPDDGRVPPSLGPRNAFPSWGHYAHRAQYAPSPSIRLVRRPLSFMDRYLALIALVGVAIGIAAVLFWVYRR